MDNLQQNILMEIIKKIIVLNKRSQLAYKKYLEHKTYYQAKRIYSANSELLGLLKDFQFTCEAKFQYEVFSSIFHLEDWFLQFEKLEREIRNLDEDFVFIRLEHSFQFPSEFFNKLNEL